MHIGRHHLALVSFSILGLSIISPAAVVATKAGKLEGKPVHKLQLSNSRGASLEILTWGAALVGLRVPDRNGKVENVVCGLDQLSDYPTKSPYFGSIVGRYGNRIANGKFKIDGKAYTLAINNPPNSLHGGIRGFDKRVWTFKIINNGTEPSVRFTYVSADGEEGFPGKLTSHVTYTLTKSNEIKIDFETSTTKKTVANLTNHAYFNLGGSASNNILDHVLTIHADRFTPVTKDLIPTGELRRVSGTPFDFLEPRVIRERIDADEEQIAFGGGYDHNFVIRGQSGKLREAAHLFEPMSGRTMRVFTTEPGMQFYSGNFLNGTLRGNGGKIYPRRYALCLETQHFPDSPNHPNFPKTLLVPGKVYRSQTIFRFGTQ